MGEKPDSNARRANEIGPKLLNKILKDLGLK